MKRINTPSLITHYAFRSEINGSKVAMFLAYKDAKIVRFKTHVGAVPSWVLRNTFSVSTHVPCEAAMPVRVKNIYWLSIKAI